MLSNMSTHSCAYVLLFLDTIILTGLELHALPLAARSYALLEENKHRYTLLDGLLEAQPRVNSLAEYVMFILRV